jgi:hypothetical protein
MVKGCLPVAMPPQHFAVSHNPLPTVLPTCLPYCGTLKSRWAETVRLLLLVPAPPLAAHEVLLTPQVAGGTPVERPSPRPRVHESNSPRRPRYWLPYFYSVVLVDSALRSPGTGTGTGAGKSHPRRRRQWAVASLLPCPCRREGGSFHSLIHVSSCFLCFLPTSLLSPQCVRS